ncbi:MAG: ArsR/SmtB family transcription factor [Promethearchaeota archaeon]
MKGVYSPLNSLNEALAAFLKLLGVPLRLEILSILEGEGEKTVSEIAKLLELKIGNVSQPSISQHLIKLKNANILSSKRERNNRYYQIRDKKIVNLLKILKEYISNTDKDVMEAQLDKDIVDTLL